MKSPESKSTAGSAIPKSDAMRNLSEDERKALDLSAHAEHETGRKREELHDQARRKTR